MDGLGRQADRTVRPHRRTPVSRGRKVGRLCQERDCRNLRILAKAFRTAFQDRSLSNGRLWKKSVFSLPSPIILPISAKPTKGMSTAKTSNTRVEFPAMFPRPIRRYSAEKTGGDRGRSLHPQES